MPSSNRVSIARSSAPVDLAAVRAVYADVAVEAERLRIGRRGDADDEEEDEYLDSVFPMDFAIDGKRTLLMPGDEGFASDIVGLFGPSSSFSELAYARPPYSDSDPGDWGDRGESRKSFLSGSSGLAVSTAGSLFLNFSKNGNRMDAADGVVGVGGIETSGGGCIARSRCEILPPGLGVLDETAGVVTCGMELEIVRDVLEEGE